jgi:hypothetical protein
LCPWIGLAHDLDCHTFFVLGASDVAEPFVIAYLLTKLRRRFQEAILFIIFAGEKTMDLYGAQNDFYDKIGKTVLSQAVIQLASPYITMAKDLAFTFASKYVKQ